MAVDQTPGDLGLATGPELGLAVALGGDDLLDHAAALDQQIVDPVIQAVDLLAQIIELGIP